jgi:polyphosphate kinase 2 (PPK2 family)
MDDVHERQHWDDYQAAYQDLIRHTSTTVAPWYVVPADHKWFTRLIVAEAVAAALMDIDPRFPTLSPDQLAQLATARTALEAS